MASIMELLFDKSFLAMFLVGILAFATVVTLGMPLLERNGLDDRLKSVARRREELRARHHAALNAKRGSFYDPSNKKVVLSCGRDEDTDPQPLANVPLALPNVEPDCEMVPDSEVPVPKYFDWTTLHEVGHAIDDKQHFMDRRAGDAAFGGWQVHGRDVAPVAKAVAQACKIAGAAGEAYVSAYLIGAKSPPPAAPAGRVDWADAVRAAEAWCDAIRVGKELWESGSGAHDHAVDGRVYHEAYGGVWAFSFGWTLLLVIQTGTIAAVAVAFARFAGVIFPMLGSRVWFGLGSVGLSGERLGAIAVIATLTAVNLRGLDTGRTVQNVFTSAMLYAVSLNCPSA